MSLIHTIESTDTTVICTTRCGHSSMLGYFGITQRYQHTGGPFVPETINSITTSQVILCIRNPYDRLNSAMENTQQRTWARDRLVSHEDLSKGLDIFSLMDIGWTESHSTPYLHNLTATNITHLLDFDNLKQYIPMSSNTFVSSVPRGASQYENWMGAYYTKEVLESEYSAYSQLVDTIPQVSVEDWNKYTDVR